MTVYTYSAHDAATRAAIAWAWFSRKAAHNVRDARADTDGAVAFIADIDGVPHLFRSHRGIVVSCDRLDGELTT